MQDLLEEIAALKAEKNAVLLAHYYQEGEVQSIADYAGDSLNLARAATKVDASTIVFCGVHFMAETAKILNPAKRVLLPDLQAGCSLAESCPADKLARYQEMLRINGRKFQTVTYINSTAAVKALSDWVVTSGNAEAVVRRVPADQKILFVPDRHLGQYLEEVTGRKMILWDGACMVHEIFSVGDLLARSARRRRPSRWPTRNARPTSANTATSSAAPRRWSGTPARFNNRPTSSSPRKPTCSGGSRRNTRDTASTPCPASPAPATSARTWRETRWKKCAIVCYTAGRRSSGGRNSTGRRKCSRTACSSNA